MKEEVDILIQFIRFNYLPMNKENKLPDGLNKKIVNKMDEWHLVMEYVFIKV